MWRYGSPNDRQLTELFDRINAVSTLPYVKKGKAKKSFIVKHTYDKRNIDFEIKFTKNKWTFENHDTKERTAMAAAICQDMDQRIYAWHQMTMDLPFTESANRNEAWRILGDSFKHLQEGTHGIHVVIDMLANESMNTIHDWLEYEERGVEVANTVGILEDA